MGSSYLVGMDNYTRIFNTKTYDYDTANKVRAQIIDQQFTELENQILTPFYQVRDEWRKIADQK